MEQKRGKTVSSPIITNVFVQLQHGWLCNSKTTIKMLLKLKPIRLTITELQAQDINSILYMTKYVKIAKCVKGA